MVYLHVFIEYLTYLLMMHRYQIFTTDADTDTILAKNTNTESNTDTTVKHFLLFLIRKTYRLSFIVTAVDFEISPVRAPVFFRSLLTLCSSPSVFTVASWLVSVVLWLLYFQWNLASYLLSRHWLSQPYCFHHVSLTHSFQHLPSWKVIILCHRWGHQSIGSIGRLVFKPIQTRYHENRPDTNASIGISVHH